MTTREQYALAVLRQGGYATGTGQLEALVCGMASEDSAAAWNPLDTEEPAPGATDYNTAGVRNYPTLEVGVDAVLRTLSLGVYNPLRALLRDETASTLAVLKAFVPAWCGGNDLWVRVFEAGFDYAAEAAKEVAGSTAVTPTPDPPAPPAATPQSPVAPTYCEARLPVLRPGDVGYPVRSLQTLLGSGLTVDGVLGPETERVLLAYKAHRSLLGGAEVGPECWSDLIGTVVNGAKS